MLVGGGVVFLVVCVCVCVCVHGVKGVMAFQQRLSGERSSIRSKLGEEVRDG